MNRLQPWLEPFTWEMVTAQNAMLCAAKNALHKPTSDGHDATEELWDNRHRDVMGLEEAVDLCRRCHRMTPFCLYHGNTFSSIIALVIRKIDLPPTQSQILRSLAGHIVAGVASDEEARAFSEFCASLS